MKNSLDTARDERRIEGKVEGRIEGKTEGKLEIAERLLRKNMSIADVQEITGLLEEDIRRISRSFFQAER